MEAVGLRSELLAGTFGATSASIYSTYIRVTAGPFFSLKRCIVQLQSFPLIEELTKRPLTRRSLPHCAPGPRRAATPFGRGVVRRKWINFVWLMAPDTTGTSRRECAEQRCGYGEAAKSEPVSFQTGCVRVNAHHKIELTGVAVCLKLIRCRSGCPCGCHPSKKVPRKLSRSSRDAQNYQ